MTALELLQSLKLLDETERIEAKRASESGKSLLETVCAFANEPGLGGGWLLLGVVREEQALFPSYHVEGITQPDKLCADLATQCRETFNSPVRIELSTEQVNGMAVIVALCKGDRRRAHDKSSPEQPLQKKASLRAHDIIPHVRDSWSRCSFPRFVQRPERVAKLARAAFV